MPWAKVDVWDLEAAQGYDTPGTGMLAPAVLGPTLDRLAQLAAGGRALEFAFGTGRVAIPLAERGVPVAGIELSGPMIEQLRTKVDETTIPVTAGDMATVRAPGEYALVFLVYNGISNLLTQSEQVACFRNAARHLAPGGRFVIELWGSGAAQAAAGPASYRLQFGSRLHQPGHPMTCCTNTRIPPLQIRHRHAGAILP
ncbi:MAG: class I SAM-dependent DNA methyltransferase [Streptosporangiaceae bacterium]